MADSGLTANGLVIEAIDDIRAGIEQDLRDTFYESLPLGDETLLGHIVGIIANSLGLLWERLEEVNDARDPDKATGPSLTALSILTGTFRTAATPSFALVTLCGDPGTTVDEGDIVATASTDVDFTSREDVTLVALAAWTLSSSYNVGDRVTNAGRCYHCIVAGVSAGGGGPTTTADDITDGSVHWQYAGEGTADADVFYDCEVNGPTQATAGDLSAIQTPVSGRNTARNLKDATLGTDEATDEILRLVRQVELSGAGGSTPDALRAQLQEVNGVISVAVFNNNTDNFNSDGVPPHSFEALVRGGEDQDVVDTIANNQAEGIGTWGTGAPITFGSHSFVVADQPTGKLTVTSHGLTTGSGPLRVSSTLTLPIGLTAGTDYWAIVVDVNTIQLAPTMLAALQDEFVVLSSNGTGTRSIVGNSAKAGPGFGFHLDSESVEQLIVYSRPQDEDIYVDISVNVAAADYPSDGDTQVEDDVLTWGQGFPVDRDVDPSAVGAQAFQVDGVLGVTRVLIYTDVIGTPVAWTPTTGYVATPGSRSVVTNDGGRCYICIQGGTSAGSGGPTGTGTDITDGGAHWYYLGNILNINRRQLAVFDSTRTAIHSTPVTP